MLFHVYATLPTLLNRMLTAPWSGNVAGSQRVKVAASNPSTCVARRRGGDAKILIQYIGKRRRRVCMHVHHTYYYYAQLLSSETRQRRCLRRHWVDDIMFGCFFVSM